MALAVKALSPNHWTTKEFLPISSTFHFILLYVVYFCNSSQSFCGLEYKYTDKVCVQTLMTCTRVPSSGDSDNCQNRNLPDFSDLFFQGSGGVGVWNRRETRTALCALSGN